MVGNTTSSRKLSRGLMMMVGALVAAGCGEGEVQPSSPGGVDSLARTRQDIQAEQPGGVAEAVWKWYGDPDIAKSSYASPVWFMPGGGTIICSAEMVGPNIMLTANHCGQPDQVTLSFLTYAADDNTAKRWEDFTCKALVGTWHSSDLSMYFCNPNAEGVSPGDKYGYFDFDTRPISVGDAVYSIWGNPLDNPSPGQYDVRFFSRGKVTSTSSYGTFTTDPAYVQVNPSTGLPDYKTSHERPIAISTDLWGNFGASGSAQISATSHRLVVGPLSTISTPDGRGRHALSIAQYLLDGTVDARDPSDIRGAHIQALGLGLTPSNYGGLLDKNGDKLFDLQVDIERARGENARDWYALDFESERRNALWTQHPSSSVSIGFDTNNRTVHFVKTATGFTPLLTHSRLNLTAGTYRISLMSYTAVAGYPDSLWFGFRRTDGALYTGKWLLTPANRTWRMDVQTLTVPADGTYELILGSDTNIDLFVSAVNVIRQGAVMNMDTADKRFHWRNDIYGNRGRVVPRGVDTTRPDWAVRVQYDPASPAGWPIRNRQFALQGGARYRLCFDHKQEASGMGGVMRVLSAGVEMTRVTFTPGTSWQRTCTRNFKVTTDDNNVQFGVTSGTGSYLVDNISIEPQRAFSSEPGIDRPGSDFRNFDLPAAEPRLCEDECANDASCVAYTYVAPGYQGASARCWLKNTVPGTYPISWCHSGVLR